MRDVNVGHKVLADYQSIILEEQYREILALAEKLEGRRVLPDNATSFGGGVAEILFTLVPLTSDVGLEAEWKVLTAEIEDGVTGRLVDSSAACAERCLEILDKPEWAAAIAKRGKEHVREHFPTPRLLRDDLRIFAGLLDKGA